MFHIISDACNYCHFNSIVPSSPPETVEAFSTSSTSIHIAWSEVPEIDHNGIILSYDLQYWKKGSNTDTQKASVEANMFFYDVDMLDSFQTYFVQVRAHTMVGPGPYSAAINVTEEQQGIHFYICLLIFLLLGTPIQCKCADVHTADSNF